MPYPGLLHPEPLPLWQSTADPYLLRRHSNTVLSQSLWGLWVLVLTRFVWALWASLAGMGLLLNMILPFLPSCWGFCFAFGCGVSPLSRSSTPCGQCCSTYHPSGASLPLDVGYLLTATPAPHSCRSSAYRLGRILCIVKWARQGQTNTI